MKCKHQLMIRLDFDKYINFLIGMHDSMLLSGYLRVNLIQPIHVYSCYKMAARIIYCLVSFFVGESNAQSE